ncbi:MAG: hypothetical protein QMD94_03070 [Candidatus Omnitrophota bacterium]|nr:hypothetical protein [Candidatus Omnitrophota bacterium]
MIRINTDKKHGLARIFFLSTLFFLLSTLIGCEAFVRKFTRKSKKQVEEVMVLAPEEYKGPQITKEELYKEYFLFWKSWQDELIGALTEKKGLKKQVDCAGEAIKNLVNLRALLKEEKQKKIDIYIDELKGLELEIAKDLYGSSISLHARSAERIKRNILRDFSYKKNKDFLR